MPILIALSALAASPASVRAAPRVTRAAIVESVQPTDISDPNAAIYGLVADETVPVTYPASSSRRDPVLYVAESIDRPRQLCLSISRAQGGYQARFQAKAPPGSGVLSVPFDSTPAAREKIAQARVTSLEMAVRASEVTGKGACSNAAPLLPTSWTGDFNNHYYLMVGGSGLGQPVIRVAGGAAEDCQLLSRLLDKSGMGAASYSFACPVRADIQRCFQPTSAVIIWFRGSRLAATADVRLRLACR